MGVVYSISTFLAMKKIVLSFTAVIASVAAFSCVWPTGVASAADEPLDRHSSVVFRMSSGLTLGRGITTLNKGMSDPVFLTHAGDKGAGYTFASRTRGYRLNDVLEVSYPILRGRYFVPTSNTVTTRVDLSDWTGFGPRWGCTVAGPDPKIVKGLHCSMERRGLDWDFELQLTHDDVNRSAEASGSIVTDGSVSLSEGKFTSESLVRQDGASEVPVNSSTQIDAVLASNEGSHESDTARMKFKYALFDDGVQVRSKLDGQLLYVEGNVSNTRGDKFTGGSKCAIVTEQGQDEWNSGYSCDTESHYALSGRIQYITDFSVSKNH